MNIIQEIEALKTPSPDIDCKVAKLFGRPVPQPVTCRNAVDDYRSRRINLDGGNVARFTASFDAVESLVIGGWITGNASWTSGKDSEQLVIANFRGKPGRGHNLACAMLAAIIRFYLPEVDVDTHAKVN